MTSDNAATTPDEQMQVRVAWLYFMEGRTQGEIADLLSTNRLRINRIINEARRSGLVSITINSRLSSCVELERALSDRFDLSRAIIVPTPVDPALVPVLLGQATADYVSQALTSSDIRGIGMGWGATMREMVRHMPALRRPELSVNSVMGGLTRGIEINTFDIASDLARLLSAECAYLAAPIYAGSPESRDAIMNQDVFRESFERIAVNDMIVLSVGDLTDRSLLVRYGLPREVTMEMLAAAGAKGDLLGQFIDADGKPIDHQINHRAIALPIEALRKVPNVILSSGGAHKVESIAAVLRSGLIDVLVCDETTARAAMALAVGRG
ncbi:DeoR faimly transcriptional regulator [Devosia limi DSM 17137]|uniref:DNA-binding transcriptional regulator LsrR, DeoR family n=1 Tax=Devosia limi DSM 17137 TaxID=1121477 RepID=A0A0F5LU03_9HYPH|nr:sugar-binding transcriptional regulator [Devosia limi]KKB85823.1 DeoR faimly transcriptional regulator [Devosia limi DSM 17137]SHE34418.1 DNA-binding transcriptional regulator LsrR, DeoR family [Devosia limi DSM 17137]